MRPDGTDADPVPQRGQAEVHERVLVAAPGTEALVGEDALALRELQRGAGHAEVQRRLANLGLVLECDGYWCC